MKNSVPIPSDVWEEKKALIAALYKDEEWPLKQVIKKIRSDNFNPSETQLRSRLKKWRVTKPSRQTRERTKESVRSPKARSHSENTSPSSTISRPSATGVSMSEMEWYMANRAYGPHGLPTVWAPASSHSSPISSPGNSRVNSHASLAIPSSASFDSSQTSPLDTAFEQLATTPTFANSPYALDTDSCLQTPVSATTAAPPAIAYWYPAFETSTRAPSISYYTTGPLTPPIDSMMHLLPPQMPEFQAIRRTLASPYEPDLTSAKVRQSQKSLDRKVSLPPKISTSQYSSGVVTPTSPFFQGQFSCPESLVHRSSIDF
ncbi:Clr5 domain-containing protein [Aspergillus mulundensis]|uniref:Clr5 domain-containing protein n=1 Tax=Aspergillus mulundensis TaxID=1810919 RepID=A0A3D8QHF9_9EURO|nr:Uncharacterized protein DSM5745_10764 [Aspergillus mulundensis]RDW61266.1 Uncharacterized protein DSM5745_10764 [Aspergillus mulundensis]